MRGFDRKMTNNRINTWEIIPLRDRASYAKAAAEWFHAKWGVPEAEYQKSINACLTSEKAVPQWYLVIDSGGGIVGGAGIIENDFHKRRDLTPNVCALYVEEKLRGNGIARALLDYVCDDAAKQGIKRLYLITDHVGLYERCGWRFLDMVEENNGQLTRMYERETLL